MNWEVDLVCSNDMTLMNDILNFPQFEIGRRAHPLQVPGIKSQACKSGAETKNAPFSVDEIYFMHVYKNKCYNLIDKHFTPISFIDLNGCIVFHVNDL